MSLFNKFSCYSNGIDFKQLELPGYYIDFIEGSKEDLVITFENADKPDVPRLNKNRIPWGANFLVKRKCTVIGIKPKAVDWYRGKDLHDFFRSSYFTELSKSYEKVSFFGSSMGGYAALAFSEAVPGSYIIAFNPQTSLDSRVSLWDKRYPVGSSQDWSGDFVDGAFTSKTAKKIYIAYDPFHKMDKLHVDRIDPSLLVPMKFPFVGHAVASWMQLAGVLPQFVEGALAGSLDAYKCSSLARSRREITRYYEIFGQYSKSSKGAEACIRGLLSAPIMYLIDMPRFRLLLNKCGDMKFLNDCEIINSRTASITNIGFILIKRISDTGNPDRALRISLEFINRWGENRNIDLCIAECLMRSGRSFEALAHYRAFQARHGECADSLRVLARIQIALNDFKGASNSAHASIMISPSPAANAILESIASKKTHSSS